MLVRPKRLLRRVAVEARTVHADLEIIIGQIRRRESCDVDHDPVDILRKARVVAERCALAGPQCFLAQLLVLSLQILRTRREWVVVISIRYIIVAVK